jgi:hypothetical protein
VYGNIRGGAKMEASVSGPPVPRIKTRDDSYARTAQNAGGFSRFSWLD